MSRHIAVLGTGSDVGKSIVAAAICRSLADKGIRVAPFKAQNMSNNSGITPEGFEMGRAQIVQAEAAGIAPHTDMNPILLKPSGEKQSQVILNGRVHANHTAMDYHREKDFYFSMARAAFDRLTKEYDRIVLEGAGSCAEVNLMASDVVNLPMAAHANADVVLTADIHRGGVFAQIVGTLACLDKTDQDRIKGFIINRFRGDIALFKDGVKWIEEQTGKRVYGVLPWYSHFRVDAEDSVEVECAGSLADLDPDRPAVGILRLPHIANFTDFHALTRQAAFQTLFVDRPARLERLDAVIIPGSKNTRADLAWLKQTFGQVLTDYHRKGGFIFGICGGYQMMGSWVEDPDGLEGDPGRTEGLNLLPVRTVLKAPKTTTRSSFTWNNLSGSGYEIHMGVSTLTGGSPLLNIQTRNAQPAADTDGCIRDDHRAAGTYVHGFFDSSPVLNAWLDMAGIQIKGPLEDPSRDKDYQLLKQHFEDHVDLSDLV